MKYKTAFFMAWGSFLALPCPVKQWDNDQRRLMLVFFPVIGLVVGIFWSLLWWVLDLLMVPPPLAAAILTVYPFIISGFIHLDGFMDCSDAILSRRPLEQRQQILKDSHVGAFAVISTIILFLLMFAALNSGTDYFPGIAGAGKYDMLALTFVPVITRGLSARAVLMRKPLGHSQYNGFDSKDNRGYAKAVLIIVVLAIVLPLAALAFDPTCIWGGIATFGMLQSFFAVFCITTLVHFMAVDYGVGQLGGMSGDISGYALTMAEAAAIITLAIV